MGDKENRTFRVYPWPLDPRNYADYYQKSAKAATCDDLRNKTQFTTIRKFMRNDNGELVSFKDELDLYTEQLKLGHVIWPHAQHIFAPNFHDLIDEIAKRGLYIFDMWEYWPGVYGDSFEWGTATEYRCPPETYRYLKEKLGGRFLGFSIGELDGNYICGYAAKTCPLPGRRDAKYLDFHTHFSEIWEDLNYDTSVLFSTNLCHYFAKEGSTVIMGAETAQAFMNVNLWYAFIRGAGKQYGIPWFGNVSSFNRWGWKVYDSEGYIEDATWNEYGPEAGTSLNLMKRLLYTLYAYNCAQLGFELGHVYTEGDKKNKLTPIGGLQADAVMFTQMLADPGTMYTPVAILMDFFNGWSPPRNFWHKGLFKVWGNMPYEEEDFQTHALFSLLYPGYEDSGYFRDERGFLTATPYADAADILFSDARREVLDAYNLVIAAGKLRLDAELFFKCKGFVENGGHLIITMGQILDEYDSLSASIPGFPAFFGIKRVRGRMEFSDSVTVNYNSREITEKPFSIFDIEPDESAGVIAEIKESGLPLILETPHGAGKVSLIASAYGMDSTRFNNCKTDDDYVEKGLPKATDLLAAVKEYIGGCLDGQKIIELDNRRLQYSVNLRKDGSLLLCVANNNTDTQNFTVTPGAGRVIENREIEILPVAKETRGYYAAGKKPEDNGIVQEGKQHIAPLDIRFYCLKLDRPCFENKREMIVKDKRDNHYIVFRKIASIEEELLTKPTLQYNFTGVKLDAGYFAGKDTPALEKEAAYLKRQNMDMIVDFTDMVNHFPGITLLDIPTKKYNEYSRYRNSLETVSAIFAKAALFGCGKAIFTPHRNAPGLNPAKAEDLLRQSVREICELGVKHGITIYLQNTGRGVLLGEIDELAEFIAGLPINNLKFALNTEFGIASHGQGDAGFIKKYAGKARGLLVSVPYIDAFGQCYCCHGRIYGSAYQGLTKELCACGDDSNRFDFICLNGAYANWSEMYLDKKAIAQFNCFSARAR